MPYPQLGLSLASRQQNCRLPLRYDPEAKHFVSENVDHARVDQGHSHVGVYHAAGETEIQIRHEVVCEL